MTGDNRRKNIAIEVARALLLSLGEEVRTHRGLVQLLHRDLVREGNAMLIQDGWLTSG
jgi:uncharacterized protein (UPF0332 family)